MLGKCQMCGYLSHDTNLKECFDEIWKTSYKVLICNQCLFQYSVSSILEKIKEKNDD
jgi:uncharacterized protein (DUF2225 family)